MKYIYIYVYKKNLYTVIHMKYSKTQIAKKLVKDYKNKMKIYRCTALTGLNTYFKSKIFLLFTQARQIDRNHTTLTEPIRVH